MRDQSHSTPERKLPILGRLLEPSALIEGSTERARARLLSVVLMMMGLACYVGTYASWLVHSDSVLWILGAGLGVSLCYLLSRTRYNLIAGVFAMALLSLPSIISVVRGDTENNTAQIFALIWLTLPMVISALIFPLLGVVLTNIGIVTMAVVTALMNVSFAETHLWMVVSFLGMVATLNIAVGVVVRRNALANEQMLRARDEAEARLREAKAELESRVAARTLELTRNNELLLAVIESSPAAVIIVDGDGRVTTWNEAARRILGWEQQEVVGEPLPFEITVSDGNPPTEDWPQEGLPAELNVDLEVSVTTRDGESVDVSLSTAPVFGQSGHRVGVLGLLVDISERKHLEEQIRHSSKMEAIGRLAGGIAHDFNNMLTVINGCSEFALESEDVSQDLREDLVQIYSAGVRAAELTRQLLAFSRKQVLKLSSVQLNDTIEHMASLLRRVLSEDTTLELELEEGLPTIMADKGQLEQIMMNLAVNARDAMPAGGVLTIKTARTMLSGTGKGEESKDSAGGQTAVALIVSDTGIGMPADIRERVFEPFFTTKGVGEGTGLGLSTVYGVVSQLGGVINLESELDQGTTFTITLPANSDERSGSSVVDSVPPCGGNERVLVIEDEAGVRSFVERVLSKLGYEVLSASGGKEAVELVRERRVGLSLVLSDVVMPEMSGLEAVDRIRGLLPEVTALFMSGHAEEELNRRGVDPKQVTIIAKPFTAEELGKAVRRALDEGVAPSEQRHAV